MCGNQRFILVRSLAWHNGPNDKLPLADGMAISKPGPDVFSIYGSQLMLSNNGYAPKALLKIPNRTTFSRPATPAKRT